MSYQISLFDIINNRKQFKIDKPIRLIELFAGYGSQHFALDYLGANFESWKICEWAIKSIQAYKDAHFSTDNTDYSKELTRDQVEEYLFNKGISSNYNDPMTLEQIKRLGEGKARVIYNNIIATHNLVSVVNCKAADLEIVDRDKYTYMLTYSFPCFTGDSMVLTSNGYKRIDEIQIGDYVLTHKNKYQKVLNFYNNGIKSIYQIKGMAIDEIKTTKNHKFLVRTRYRKWDNSKRTYLRLFEKPKWKEVEDISKNDYLGIAINQNSIIPIWNGINFEWKDGRKPRHKNELNKYMDNKNFWWIVGRYIGDGWLRKQGGIIICCDKNKTDEIEIKLQNLFNYSISQERTVNKIHIPLKELGYFCEQFGKGAKNKRLTNTIIDLPTDLLESFINGYESADGCICKGNHKISSISRELIYGIGQCIAKVYKTPYKIYKVNPPKTKIIENRLVNQNSWYQLVYKTEKKKQDKAFYEDGYIWYPISSIEYIGEENVYDIEIENDHSFTVQNTIVHNCQDLSKAGLGRGMEKGSGTRSGLLWEVERILEECNGNLPHVLIMENVPDVIGEKNKLEFAKWYQKLESLGYANFYKILNAKDYGIPQNRERCFMVSVLVDYYYIFPKQRKLEKRLKDFLEPHVDEKYFLSDKMIQGMINTKFESYKMENKLIDQNGIANTIIARFEGTPQCIAVKEATKKGYAEAQDGDGVYINRPEQKRGVVQKGMIQTIKTSPDIGVVVREEYQGMYQYAKSDKFMQGKDRFTKNKELADTILTTPKEGVVVKLGNYSPSGHNAASIVDSEGIAPTVMENHGTVTATVVNDEIKPKLVGGIGEKKSNGGTQYYQQDRIYDSESIAMAHPANLPGGSYKYQVNIPPLRIRKLSPLECWRLMGVKDQDFDKIAKNQSNSSLYHLAGDSIVVDVLKEIISMMLD